MSSGKTIRAISNFSHPGQRLAQEDHAFFDKDRKIFVMADGFGGPGPGVEASRLACESVRSFLIKEAGDREATLPFVLRSYYSLAGNVLFNSLIHANRQLNLRNKGKGVHERGGASVLAAYMDGDLLAIANVGGCGAWIFRGNALCELFTPRTYARLCDPSGQDMDPARQVPLMACGITSDLEPEIFEYRVKEGDFLLLHTDGVGPEVRDQIWEILQKSPRPEAVENYLKNRQFDDNASMLMVFF
ncbi:protein phosphatase 2C domain-containing protein [Bdellovibrionota bacterium FG-2]